MKKNSISVREKTYEALKYEIISGGFDPGERLTEEHLAEKLGVSRTPVREALHKLELEGLIKPLATRGFCVPKDSVEEVEEIFDIRAILEGFALRLICQSIEAKDIQRLNGIIEKAEQAYRQKDTEKVFQYNTEFHDSLYALINARKPRLMNIMGDMRKYVLRYRKDTLHYLKGARRSLDGHKKIILALELKDCDLCERVMREHVYESMEDAFESINENLNLKQPRE